MLHYSRRTTIFIAKQQKICYTIVSVNTIEKRRSTIEFHIQINIYDSTERKYNHGIIPVY